jgi:hypothetical protein
MPEKSARRRRTPAGKRTRARKAKRPARARAKRPIAKRSGASKRARKGAKRSTRSRAAPPGSRRPSRARPTLRAVRRRTSKPAVALAFRQRGGASSKQLVLFELLRARTAFLGAIQGLPAASAEQPLAPGKWNARQVVLHVVARDRARLRELETALRGTKVSWADVTPEQMDRLNEADLASLKALDWEEARRLLYTTRHELMEALESVPDEPSEVWNPEHTFGWMLHVLPTHDHHHAEALKRWRAERGV